MVICAEGKGKKPPPSLLGPTQPPAREAALLYVASPLSAVVAACALLLLLILSLLLLPPIYPAVSAVLIGPTDCLLGWANTKFSMTYTRKQVVTCLSVLVRAQTPTMALKWVRNT